MGVFLGKKKIPSLSTFPLHLTEEKSKEFSNGVSNEPLIYSISIRGAF